MGLVNLVINLKTNKGLCQYINRLLIPDLLTISRGIICIVILCFIPFGIANVHIFIILYIIAWTTDALDGGIARYLGINGKLAKWDYYLDIFLQFTIITYTTFIKSISLNIFLIFIITWIFVSLIVRNKAIIHMIGTIGLIIHLISMYWFDEFLFWILIIFWIFFFIMKIKRIVKCIQENIKIIKSGFFDK